MKQTKEIVKIYRKKLTDGRESLYLAYDGNGRRETLTLKLYLNPGKDAITKSINEATLVKARLEQARHIKAILEGKSSGLAVQADSIESMSLAEYFRYKRDKCGEESTMVDVYDMNAKRMDAYGKVSKPMSKLTVNDVRGLIKWLRGKYAESTAHSSYTLINTALKTARRDNPMDELTKAERPKMPDSTRRYLSMDELRKAINTECKYPYIKAAFMFSCFTGLRMSDVKRLEWNMFKDGRITIKQKKPGRYVTVPVSENAKRWLPKKGKGFVWPELAVTHRNMISKQVKKWMKAAGIEGNITFHVSRHTCATMLLEYGADIYTVSKILGHADISTTQIYAKVVDRKKDEAVNNIPKL